MLERGDIERAVAVLRAGGLLAYPTEGVWGRAAIRSAARGHTPARAQAARRRQGLILVAASAAQLDGRSTGTRWTRLARRGAGQLARAAHPGGAGDRGRAGWIPRAHEAVAVRVSASGGGRAVRCLGRSAGLDQRQPGGKPAPVSRDGLAADIVAGVDLVVAGETSGLGQPAACAMPARVSICAETGMISWWFDCIGNQPETIIAASHKL